MCGKTFERLIYNKMFNYFSSNKLISKNQSGFQPGNSCINQLLKITHKIFTSSDNGLEVTNVFLDISKAFDKVWHEGLIFKLKPNGISCELLHTLSDLLAIGNKGFCLMFKICHGPMSMLEFYKDLF